MQNIIVNNVSIFQHFQNMFEVLLSEMFSKNRNKMPFSSTFQLLISFAVKPEVFRYIN